MKILLTLLLASLLNGSSNWLTDMQQARSLASQENRYILLNFSGSDWCGPCIRMHKEIFESDQFISYASDKLVLVNADFPRLRKNQLSKEQTKMNEALADQYNPGGKFPFTVLLDSKGNVLRSWEGFANFTPDNFIGQVNSVVNAVK